MRIIVRLLGGFNAGEEVEVDGASVPRLVRRGEAEIVRPVMESLIQSPIVDYTPAHEIEEELERDRETYERFVREHERRGDEPHGEDAHADG